MSVRSEKVASVIKRAIVTPLSDLASEHSAGLVSVTSVKLSPDLQVAKIYVSLYGGKISPGKFIDIIEDNKGHFRTYISSKIRLKFAPELRFFLDDTLEQMEHIKSLLDSVPKVSSKNKFDISDYDEKHFPDNK
jgi:ribosome-binding factor A